MDGLASASTSTGERYLTKAEERVLSSAQT